MASSGSDWAIRRVESLISAKLTVRLLRSPPLALSARSMSPAIGRCEGTAVKGALQFPQNWLFGRFECPQATQTIPKGLPQFSQNAFVGLFSLLQYRQSIRKTLSHHGYWADYRLTRCDTMANTAAAEQPWANLPQEISCAARHQRLSKVMSSTVGCRTRVAARLFMIPALSLANTTLTGKVAPNAGTKKANSVSESG